jgi:hypothetical protein
MKYLLILNYHLWRIKLDEQTILQYSKDLTLNFLKDVGATIDESHGLYTITLPDYYESIFGGRNKRITFEHSVADTLSCEWVVPGSNFLAIVLGEIKKQAPVIGGHLKKHVDSPKDCLEKFNVQNCDVILDSFSEEMKIAIRFYFNINVKSIKSISMVRWIDVDLETLQTLDFPSEIELDPDLGTIKYEKSDSRIDHCYSKATEVLQEEMKPLIMQFVTKTQDSLNQDLQSLNQVHSKRVQEISEDVQYQEQKLNEFDRKILKARSYQTRTKYTGEKQKQRERIKKAEQRAVKQIEKLAQDKNAQKQQIEKRHRPVIDFSLIAGTAFSYSTSKCNILLKNQFAQKETKAEFLEPSQEFIVFCEACGRRSEQSHLCMNSHVSCEFCTRQCVKCKKEACMTCKKYLNPCYICKEGICTDCDSHCNFCNELTCENHFMACPHCSVKTCFFCSDNCEYCGTTFCSKSIRGCHACQKRTCINDSTTCVNCNHLFCPKDIQICAICDKNHCKKDSSKCQFCEQIYSTNCMNNNLCQSCSKLSEVSKDHSRVQEAISVSSDLKKYKKWEMSENNRFCVFKAKKMLGSKIIVYDKNLKKIIIDKKGGWR